MRKKITLGILLAIAVFGFQACQKDLSTNSSNNNGNLNTNLKAAVADVVTTQVTEISLEDAHSVALEKFDGTDLNVTLMGAMLPRDLYGRFMRWGNGPLSFGIPFLSRCATVTVSSATYPKEITIDYGSGCSDGWGPVKKGKIIISISDSLSKAGATRTITYQDFYIDSIKVDYTSSIRNMGQNSQGHWIIASSMDQTISNTDSIKISEKMSDSVEWVSGFGTVQKSDDSYYTSGSGSISINDTAVYSKVITKPLLTDRSCQFIESGTVVLTRNGSTVVIDYGDGTCDSKATVTTNGTTEDIDLYTSRFNDRGIFGKHCHGFGGDGKGRFGF